jgi:predicted phage terminase large subunit-like protein
MKSLAGEWIPPLSEIDRELDRRRRAPKTPADLAKLASGGRWHDADHLDLLNRKLCDLAAGRIRRLIVTMPPRHGKSQLCSRYFPAWFLGNFPNERVILCSYEAGFAAEWGGRVRDILEDHGRDLFGIEVRDDSRARDDWQVAGRDGGMKTAGVGGPITGRGANILIIDDPVKNAEEANSEVFREKTWQWWLTTALTRVEPNGGVLLIMTRWHEDDLAGRLMKQDAEGDTDEPEEKWHILNLPAIAEEGDALGRKTGAPLWEERWPLRRLMGRMKRLGSYVWNALYQQRPSPPKGNYFKREWFKLIPRERMPKMVDLARCWDLAATADDEGADPDWLVGTKMAKCIDDNYYIFKPVRERVTPEGVRKNIKLAAEMDGRGCKVRIEQEGAASGKIVKYEYERMLDGYDARFTPIPKSSKFVRSGGFNAACERGQVFLIEGDWVDEWIDELTTFPRGKHDDRVDSAVGAYEALSGGGEPWEADDLEAVTRNKYEQ